MCVLYVCVGVIFAEIFAWQCSRGEYCGFLICIPPSDIDLSYVFGAHTHTHSLIEPRVADAVAKKVFVYRFVYR